MVFHKLIVDNSEAHNPAWCFCTLVTQNICELFFGVAKWILLV